MSNKVFGNTRGLKSNQIKRAQKLYDRSITPDQLISPDLARTMIELSQEIRRQIGVLINRRGKIEYVMIGDAGQINLPDIKRVRAGTGRFRGLRHVHVILDEKGLRQDTLVDLALLRLDLVAAISPAPGDLPGITQVAHLMPQVNGGDPWRILPAKHFSAWTDDISAFITELENEFSDSVGPELAQGAEERAMLVHVYRTDREEAEMSMLELVELARSAGVDVAETIIHRQDRINPKSLIGKGKLMEIGILSMGLGAELLIIDHNLSAGQARTISETLDIKVIDRTQLILDIFAQRANSKDGKFQVELAQLKYLLPRLAARDDSLSRLTGGIGARGPGETKLEVGRRHIKNRINRLQDQLAKQAKARNQRRSLRQNSGIPIVSIVGYTNAGKSTLLNALTRSDVHVEDKLFATLDTSSRRLRFPREREVIITDTVGFIRDLPKDLIAAFKATLEELEDANLLLHVVDASSKDRDKHKLAVEGILEELGLEKIPRLLVYNKIDLLSEEELAALKMEPDIFAVSAAKRTNFIQLQKAIERHVWKNISASTVVTTQYE